MVPIVFIHGFNLNIRYSDGIQPQAAYWLRFLESFVSDGLCRVAVPLFFAISGFLGAQAFTEDFTIPAYFRLLWKRLNSLVIPYLSVSLLGIVFVCSLQIFPFSRPFFNNYSIQQNSLGDWLFVWLVAPVPYQLWFIRFLVFYFILFPLVYYTTKYFKLLVIIWLIYFWSDFAAQARWGFIKLEVEGMLFFSLGVFLAIQQVDMLVRMRFSVWIPLLLIWLVWVGVRTQMLLHVPIDHYGVHYNLIGFTILGVLVVWFGFDFFSRYILENKWLEKNARYSFGVFLFHEPALTIIKKIAIRVLHGSTSSLAVSYIVAPVIAFVFALWFSKMCNRYLPMVYGILTGNRRPTLVSS